MFWRTFSCFNRITTHFRAGRDNRFKPFSKRYSSQRIFSKDIGDLVVSRPITKNLWTVLTLTAGCSALAYYYGDWDNTPQLKLTSALNNINKEEMTYKLAGFDMLKEGLGCHKRTFSGNTGIIIDSHSLVTDEVMQMLVYNLSLSSTTQCALMWIYKLISDPSTSTEATLLLLNNDPQLNLICQILNQDQYHFLPHTKSNKNNWLIAAHILLNIPAAESKVSNNKSFLTAVKSMIDSKVPMAEAAAQQLLLLLPPHLPSTDNLQEYFNQTVTQTPCLLSYPTELAKLNDPFVAAGPKANIYSISLFSLFGAICSRLHWEFLLRSKDYIKLIEGQDPANVKVVKKQFLRRHGSSGLLFTLFTVDYVLSLLLKTSSPSTVEVYDQRLPMLNFILVLQTCLLTIGSTIAVRSHWINFFPIALCGLYNNFDLVEKRYPGLRKRLGTTETNEESLKE